MKTYFYILLFLYILTSSNIYANDLLIEKDGNYISTDRTLITSDKFYKVSAVFTYETSSENQESYIQVGFVPYGKDGETICQLKDFPLPFEKEDRGFILLDTLIFEKNSTYKFNRTIKLKGISLREISYVIGVSLADKTKVKVSKIKIEPIDTDIAENSLKGSLASKGHSNTLQIEDVKSIVLDKTLPSFDSIDDKANENGNISTQMNIHRIIYVNSDIGSDKFEGFKRKRGQADGPKKTIRSALEKVYDGGTIVLQESTSNYKVNALTPKSNSTLVIRAEGSVVIKSK